MLFRCSDGNIFGTEAANVWSKLMQWADGEHSFKKGYETMKRKYRNDRARLEYIEELFRDPEKALFKREWSFTNAVVVDVCECLFFALKSWTSGNSKKPTSLLMAVVRIVEGCRRMMLKPFLYDVGSSLKKMFGKSQPSVVKFLFHNLRKHLTKRATETMFKSVTTSWSNFTVRILDEVILVTSCSSDDVFRVDENFKCFSNHQRPCWIQIYTGLPCKHVLLATIQKLRLYESEDEKQEVMLSLVSSCHKNWLRTTYSKTKLVDLRVPCEPPIPYDVTPDPVRTVQQRWMTRFQEVIKYCPPKFVDEALDVMERRALDESSDDEQDETNNPDYSDDSDDDQSSVDTEVPPSSPSPRVYYHPMTSNNPPTKKIRNPPKRVHIPKYDRSRDPHIPV